MAMLPSQGMKVGEESLGMHFGQCALYTRAGASEGRPCIPHTDTNHLSSTPDGGLLLLTGRQGMKSHTSVHQQRREVTLLQGVKPISLMP